MSDPWEHMTSFRLNHTFLLALIIAFLSAQWSISHIHLVEHHDHDGSHHQHKSEVHTHNSIDKSIGAIDFAHQSNDLNVVELDREINSHKVDQPQNPFAALISSAFPRLSVSLPHDTLLPVFLNTKIDYLSRSTVSPRAPPLFV